MFRTQIDIVSGDLIINHNTQMMLLGSCFSEQIGKKLADHKFHVDINPFGILYNPTSILNALERLICGSVFTVQELFLFNGIYHSEMHHGSFSSTKSEDTLKIINDRFEKAVSVLLSADLLLITFGTAWVYQQKGNNRVVANCHKLPAHHFSRFRLSVEEIVCDWKVLIPRLQSYNRKIKLLFTVSPVRHLKGGAHENQLSKSVLFLAIEELQRLFPKVVYYFPAYELMQDELRDYRFYDDDMLHPSALAVNYIWDRFTQAYFAEETCRINKEWTSIRQAIEHRPLHPQSDAYHLFRQQTANKLKMFIKRYPYISCDKEQETLNL